MRNPINIMELIENGKTAAAKNLLSAFINHVNAQRGNLLTYYQAEVLLTVAQWLIDYYI